MRTDHRVQSAVHRRVQRDAHRERDDRERCESLVPQQESDGLPESLERKAHQSFFSASTGLIRMALRAGRYAASSATANRIMETTAKSRTSKKSSAARNAASSL